LPPLGRFYDSCLAVGVPKPTHTYVYAHTGPRFTISIKGNNPSPASVESGTKRYVVISN
jgi:hypothetical protein